MRNCSTCAKVEACIYRDYIDPDKCENFKNTVTEEDILAEMRKDLLAALISVTPDEDDTLSDVICSMAKYLYEKGYSRNK